MKALLAIHDLNCGMSIKLQQTLKAWHSIS